METNNFVQSRLLSLDSFQVLNHKIRSTWMRDADP